MLECEDIACERGGRLLFEGLGFCLQPGSLLLVKGGNGSGKTSLIRILSGILTPASGAIRWKGEKIERNYTFRRDMMYIGHKSGVKGDLTVLENIRCWAQLYDTQEVLEAALHFFDLNDYKDEPARNLSAGWQRRVALARLIVVPSPLWVLDEPTNFLDEPAVDLMASLIETRVKQGGIVVMASHIMNSSIAAHSLYLTDFRA